MKNKNFVITFSGTLNSNNGKESFEKGDYKFVSLEQDTFHIVKTGC